MLEAYETVNGDLYFFADVGKGLTGVDFIDERLFRARGVQIESIPLLNQQIHGMQFRDATPDRAILELTVDDDRQNLVSKYLQIDARGVHQVISAPKRPVAEATPRTGCEMETTSSGRVRVVQRGTDAQLVSSDQMNVLAGRAVDLTAVYGRCRDLDGGQLFWISGNDGGYGQGLTFFRDAAGKMTRVFDSYPVQEAKHHLLFAERVPGGGDALFNYLVIAIP